MKEVEIRSVDRSAFLRLDHECTTPAHLEEPRLIGVNVSQSAYGFAGKTSSVWISREDVEQFVDDLRDLPVGSMATLTGMEDQLQIAIRSIGENHFILESTLKYWYPCTTDVDCELQSMVTFKINKWELKDAISGLHGLCQLS